jgi:hypothetical protein
MTFVPQYLYAWRRRRLQIADPSILLFPERRRNRPEHLTCALTVANTFPMQAFLKIVPFCKAFLLLQEKCLAQIFNYIPQTPIGLEMASLYSGNKVVTDDSVILISACSPIALKQKPEPQPTPINYENKPESEFQKSLTRIPWNLPHDRAANDGGSVVALVI